ncbi:MAG: peptidylprolyl isomerase [bacterium]
MENKKLDGVNKIDKNEAEVSRKVVLTLLNEKDPRDNKKFNPGKIVKKNIDGAVARSTETNRAKRMDKLVRPENLTEAKKDLREVVGDIAPPVQEIILPEKVAVPALVKEKNEEKSLPALEALIKYPWANGKDKTTEDKKKEREKKEKEKKKREKKKKEKKKKEKKKKEKKYNLNKPKQKEDFNFSKKKINLLNQKSWQARIISACSKTFLFFLFALVFYFLIYSISAALIIKTGVDNNFFRKITEYFPVPAMITKDCFVDYYKYQDTKDGLIGDVSSAELDKETKLEIIKDIIYGSLIKKYNIKSEDLDDKESMQDYLAYQVASDEDINQIAIYRIKKIAEEIADTGDFLGVALRYGDQSGTFSLTNENKNSFDFTEKIKDLKNGEVSPVVFTKEGYYIFKMRKEEYSFFEYSYVFVAGLTLDEYLAETAQDYKIWSFVN